MKVYGMQSIHFLRAHLNFESKSLCRKRCHHHIVLHFNLWLSFILFRFCCIAASFTIFLIIIANNFFLLLFHEHWTPNYSAINFILLITITYMILFVRMNVVFGVLRLTAICIWQMVQKKVRQWKQSLYSFILEIVSFS